MPLSGDEVRWVAHLARLELTEEELATMTPQLAAIVAYVDLLGQVDTEGVEPMSQVIYETEETATLRPDVERAPLGNDLALANAPAPGNGYFKVPKVIER